MTEAVFIIGIALGILLGLIVGVAVTALVMVSVDEADKAAAYYYGVLRGRDGTGQTDARKPEEVGENGTV